MNIEWLKNKLGEKFYPITHVGSVLCGDSNETLETKLVALDENDDSIQTQITTNLLKPTLGTTTQNGVTCTNNGDGTYTLDGTATSNSNFTITSKVPFSEKYKFIGCPKGGKYSTFSITAVYFGQNSTYLGENCDVGNGANFVLEHYGSTEYIDLLIVIKSGITVSNLVFKPMITTNLNATYDDFVPFTGTTGKLSGDVAELEKGKMKKENPTGTGAFSMNRKDGTIVGKNSHTEGSETTASDTNSHAEGNLTKASGVNAHAEGWKTVASGISSHAECALATASGMFSHAEGYGATASGDYSHAGGKYTKAGYQSQTVIGEYNNNKEINLFEVGNGKSNFRSNALELTKTGDLKIAGGLLDTVISMIVDHIYEGVDLTVKFASEIANYSDEWAWIKARVTDGNYAGIHVGDYIPITCSNGYVLNAQIAGINTYTGYGDQQVGNHIDFICKELWDDLHVMNKVNYNNGNANSPSPFLASDLNYWLNSMSGTVPNSESDQSVTTEVDYTAGGVLYYLPDKLKNQIIAKRILLPSRYIEGHVLTNDNSWAWQSTGKLWIPSEVEVYGAPCWGNSGYGMGGFVQYTLFSCNINRAKLRCGHQDHWNWWLLSAATGNSAIFADVAGSGICNYSNTATATGDAAPVCFRI